MEMREGCSSFQFPPGFRFHPSDQELIVHYLQNKVTSRPLPASVIAEIDLYKFNPWELPKKALFGEDEWYFFSPRDRKYPNGARPNRAAASGYWKATGTDKPILTSSGSRSIGVKKGLVFYTGRPPKGIKTDWIMNEYRVLDTTLTASRFNRSMRLDDWVLCRVRQKGNKLKNTGEVQENPTSEIVMYLTKIEEQQPNTDRHNNTDLITDYLYKDCGLLASILAGQALPPIKSIPNLSFQGSNNGNIFTSVSKDGCNKVNIYSNEGKLNEENKYENLLPPSKTLPNNMYDMNCYCQSQYQDEIFKHNPLEPDFDFQELNRLAFMGKYLQ